MGISYHLWGKNARGRQDFLLFAPTDAHTAPRVRCAVRMPFLCHSTKKWRKKRNSDVPSEPSLRARANVAALSLRSYLREVLQLQILRWRFDTKSPTRMAPAGCHARAFANGNAPCVCTNFKRNGTAKIFANSKPICGVEYMPRRWRNFDIAKSPAVCRKTAGGAVSKGGSLWSAFLVRSFSDEKE